MFLTICFYFFLSCFLLWFSTVVFYYIKINLKIPCNMKIFKKVSGVFFHYMMYSSFLFIFLHIFNEGFSEGLIKISFSMIFISIVYKIGVFLTLFLEGSKLTDQKYHFNEQTELYWSVLLFSVPTFLFLSSLQGEILKSIIQNFLSLYNLKSIDIFLVCLSIYFLETFGLVGQKLFNWGIEKNIELNEWAQMKNVMNLFSLIELEFHWLPDEDDQNNFAWPLVLNVKKVIPKGKNKSNEVINKYYNNVISEDLGDSLKSIKSEVSAAAYKKIISTFNNSLIDYLDIAEGWMKSDSQAYYHFWDYDETKNHKSEIKKLIEYESGQVIILADKLRKSEEPLFDLLISRLETFNSKMVKELTKLYDENKK